MDGYYVWNVLSLIRRHCLLLMLHPRGSMLVSLSQQQQQPLFSLYVTMETWYNTLYVPFRSVRFRTISFHFLPFALLWIQLSVIVAILSFRSQYTFFFAPFLFRSNVFAFPTPFFYCHATKHRFHLCGSAFTISAAVSLLLLLLFCLLTEPFAMCVGIHCF